MVNLAFLLGSYLHRMPKSLQQCSERPLSTKHQESQTGRSSLQSHVQLDHLLIQTILNQYAREIIPATDTAICQQKFYSATVRVLLVADAPGLSRTEPNRTVSGRSEHSASYSTPFNRIRT